MTGLQRQGHTRADYLEQDGTLCIVRSLGADDVRTASGCQLEPFVVVRADGTVIGFHGHVDLGTGIRTALAQIVAEELDISPLRVNMILGDPVVAPEQGPTIASETIQLYAAPLRAAAAQARHYLLVRASTILGVDVDALSINDGVISNTLNDNRRIAFGDIIGENRIRLELDPDVSVKHFSRYRVVGTSTPRVDLPAKATGELVFVHDMRVPGMLHGRVVRPPYGGIDAGDFVGRSFVSLDESSVSHIPGIVKIVRDGDFVGIVAEREEQAEAAMRALNVTWTATPRLDLTDLATALIANPSTPRLLLEKGNVAAGLATAHRRVSRTYTWPYQMHASIGPSAALAQYEAGGLRVWSGTQNPGWLRSDLARLLEIDEEHVEVIRMEAAGCFGRNGADDVTADAALLSRAVGAPVRVQLTRDQEHVWEPKGAAQLMTVEAGLDVTGDTTTYDFTTRYPSNASPTLALLLTGKVAPTPAVLQMGDRTAIGPYEYENHRVVCHDMPPIVRAAWLRGVSAMPNTFAHESFMDEAAAIAGIDPIAYRLRFLKDARAIALIKELAARVGWEQRTGPRQLQDENGLLHGQGFAYAQYVHSKFPGLGAAWSAWVADVVVNPRNGEVAVTKVTVGQDSGLMINPDGVRHQIHGNVIQSVSRVTREEVAFSEIAVASRDWGSYPLLTFPELPQIDVMMLDRPNEPAMGVGESASVPSAAAIANAIFDATGVRFCELPFTPDRILSGLNAGNAAQAKVYRRRLQSTVSAPVISKVAKSSWFASIATAAGSVVGALGLMTLQLHSPIAPVASFEPGIYSAQTIARGKALAGLGSCFTCHTAENGEALAGGRPLPTPFGTIYTTNITPDRDTGIGAWSYAAFERAMRAGVHRDGRHLYPAFPFTSFAKTTDADLQALYAFLLSQPAVHKKNRPHDLKFPFNVRSLMAIWNSLFHNAAEFSPDASRSKLWNRGAYLVEGLGHCSACHSPRNSFGAERKGSAHLSGGEVEGWSAPAIAGPGESPIAWREDDFYEYLRTGFSPAHGAVAGPMIPVVAELKGLPDEDIRAIAHYLGSLVAPQASKQPAATITELDAAAAARVIPIEMSFGAQIFDGACGVCHEPGKGPQLFGVKPSLAVNTAVHARSPDNLIRAVLHGIQPIGLPSLGAMPAFKYHFDDGQLAELISYIRYRFAPDRAAWEDLAQTIGRIRAESVPN